MNFVSTTVPAIMPMNFQVRTSPSNAAGSTNMPTEIRKKGINKVFPAKTRRFISGLCSGISRLKAAPARKAPIIGSMRAKLDT